MKKVFWTGAAILALACGTMAFAQPWQGWKSCGGWCKEGGGPGGKGPGMMYDPAKAETVKGEVTAVEQISGRRGLSHGIGLKLKTAAGTLAVHLGPQWYVEQQGEVKIKPGDTVEVTGVKARRGDEDIFIAGEVRRGEDVLKLRDESGMPLWAGWRKAGCKGMGMGPGTESKPVN